MPVDLMVLLAASGALAVVVGLVVWQSVRQARRRSVRRAGLPTVMNPEPAAIRVHPVEYVLAAAILVGAAAYVLPRWQATRRASATAPAATAPDPQAQRPQPQKTPSPGPQAQGPQAGSAPSPAPTPTSPEGGAAPLQAPSGDAVELRWCDRGDAMLAAGQYGMAAQAFSEALRVSPGLARARSGLARAQRAEAARRAEDAVRSSEWGPEAAPRAGSRPGEAPRVGSSHPEGGHPSSEGGWVPEEDARYHRGQGDSYMRRGLYGLAVREYEKALQSDPADTHARDGLEEARRRILAGR